MKIFISWSGERSKHIALSLRKWLRRVIQSLDPWMSEKDIGPGNFWTNEIVDALNASVHGIACVTPENMNSPCMNFEVGALRNHVDPRTYTLLYGVEKGQVDGPLGQIQHVHADREGLWSIIESINADLGKLGTGTPLDPELLKDSFEKNWPEIETAVQKAAKIESKATPERTDSSMIAESLELLRGISRRLDNPDLWRGSFAETNRLKALLKGAPEYLAPLWDITVIGGPAAISSFASAMENRLKGTVIARRDLDPERIQILLSFVPGVSARTLFSVANEHQVKVITEYGTFPPVDSGVEDGA